MKFGIYSTFFYCLVGNMMINHKISLYVFFGKIFQPTAFIVWFLLIRRLQIAASLLAAASKKRRRTPKLSQSLWWPQHFRTPFEAEMLFALCDAILKFIRF